MTHPEQLGINPRFIEEYLVAIGRSCRIHLTDIYMAAWGTNVQSFDDENGSGIEFRPLLVNAQGNHVINLHRH